MSTVNVPDRSVPASMSADPALIVKFSLPAVTLVKYAPEDVDAATLSRPADVPVASDAAQFVRVAPAGQHVVAPPQ
jgi:hypothetical protein